MTVKVIGLIKLQDNLAFEEYRSQVSQTIELYEGKVLARGAKTETLWNKLDCEDFNGYVEIEFPSEAHAQRWAHSPEYQALLEVRHKAMKLTLFAVTV